MVTSQNFREFSQAVVRTLVLIALICAPETISPSILHAQESSDPLSVLFQLDPDTGTQESRALIAQALSSFTDERLLDGRSLLMKALKKDPENYQIYLLLADYYYRHVGHFRLALKYILKTQQLFISKQGPPPYPHYAMQIIHSEILYALTQVRLNLDDYTGALETIQYYESLGYYTGWVPGSKAWILMKLGRLEEAIGTARIGIINASSPGGVLNILGILLSMHNERKTAIEVFKKAIEYERSLGPKGQAATPLNNAGEVYNEIFQEKKAKLHWTEAVRRPDGCTHILPSLNLAFLHINMNRLAEAQKALQNFENCFAQFPLNNGEEHQALMHLARGRIYFFSGDIDQALTELEAAQEKQQWFGKIGTNLEELEAAVYAALADALEVKNKQLKQSLSISEWFTNQQSLMLNKVRIWWYRQKALQIFIDQVNDFEDLQIKHTDSMLDYTRLGHLLKPVSLSLLERKIGDLQKQDHRKETRNWYNVYLATSLLSRGNDKEAYKLLEDSIPEFREYFDEQIKLEAESLQLHLLNPESKEYLALSLLIFRKSRARLRISGLPLPVRFDTGSEAADYLEDLGFLYQKNSTLVVNYSSQNTEHSFQLSDKKGTVITAASGADLKETVKKFTTEVFRLKLPDLRPGSMNTEKTGK